MNPLYRYRAADSGCSHCREPGFEELQGVNDALVSVCPKCGERVEKSLSRPGRDYATDKRLSESRSDADYKRMGLKKYRKKAGGGYEREA